MQLESISEKIGACPALDPALGLEKMESGESGGLTPCGETKTSGQPGWGPRRLVRRSTTWQGNNSGALAFLALACERAGRIGILTTRAPGDSPSDGEEELKEDAGL
jgi:hypothetical protein